MSGRGRETGRDTLGLYTRHWWRWTADEVTFETAARLYSSGVVFEQLWHAEAQSTNGGALTSTFPSFALPNGSHAPRRGFLQYDGDMGGQLYKLGPWQRHVRGVASGMAGTAPLVVFRADLAVSVVLSPMSSFMSAAQHYDGRTLSYGLLPSVTSVPRGHVLEVLLSVGRGVNAAMLSWGDWLLSRYGKRRHDAWRRDATLRTLGYCTQNGAYYYYNLPKTATSYEELLLSIAAHHRRERLPTRYWLADSWWYKRDDPPPPGVPRGGVVEWEALNDSHYFPHGLERVFAATGWRVQAHARYWSARAVYATANGGAHDFLVDKRRGFALPASQSFWEALFARGKSWGLETFEQDWMNAQTERFPPLLTNATLGTAWMRQMGAAAVAQNVSIQLCMAYSRHVLASVESPSFSQVRGSGDYRAGNDLWAPLGVTGLFAYAVGLAPSKDTFWTTRVQPGNRWGPGTQEPFGALQAAVATLTAGPFCPSDALGKADRELVMRAVAADGTLLQPGRPATLIDRAFLAAAGLHSRAAGGDEREPPTGEVWSSDWTISGLHFAVVLAARLHRPLELAPADIGIDQPALSGSALVAVDASTRRAAYSAAPFGSSSPLRLRRCAKADFQLVQVSERHPVSGWALLGEVRGKIVAVSPARFVRVGGGEQRGPERGLRVLVKGEAGEEITVAFAPPPAQQQSQSVVEVTCLLPESGVAVVSVPRAKGERIKYCL